MTVTTRTTFITYFGTGTQRNFYVPFQSQDDADISVSLDGVPQTSGYSIDYSAYTDGRSTVVFVTAPDDGATIRIERDVRPLTQETDLVTFGRNKIEAIEDALDRITMAFQEYDGTSQSLWPNISGNASFTIGGNQVGGVVRYTNGSDYTITLEDSVSDNFPLYGICFLVNTAGGKLTISVPAGSTAFFFSGNAPNQSKSGPTTFDIEPFGGFVLIHRRSETQWEVIDLSSAGGHLTDTPTTDPGWANSSSIDMNAPDGYIKTYVGTQAVVVPYWNT